MKKSIVYFSALTLLLAACDTNDDAFYNTKYVKSQDNLVSIATQTDYDIDDVLYINVNIPREVQVQGEPGLLNVFETTGGAQRFIYSYYLEKKISETTWELIDMTNLFVGGDDNGIAGSFVQGVAKLNTLGTAYQSTGGIRLTQNGTFRITFSLNSSAPDRIGLRSDSRNNNITLILSSDANAIDGSSSYTFTVD
jgi:hypothetical protein